MYMNTDIGLPVIEIYEKNYPLPPAALQLLSQSFTPAEITRWEKQASRSPSSAITRAFRIFMAKPMRMRYLDCCMPNAKMILSGWK